MSERIPVNDQIVEGIGNEEVADRFQEDISKDVEELVDQSSSYAAAQEDRETSGGKADLLAKEIKSGSGSGKLSRFLKAFALGATLIAGNPAQADVVPDAPKPEAIKKESREMEKTRSWKASDPKYGDFTVEVFRDKNAKSWKSYSETYEVHINGKPRRVVNGIMLRNGLMNFEIEGSVSGMNERVFVPAGYGEGSGGSKTYTIVDPETHERVDLVLE